MTALSRLRAELAAGILGPIAFVVLFTVEGAVRDGYDPVRHFVSLLSLGDRGWLQITNFVVGGSLFAIFGLAIGRSWAVRSPALWVPRLLVVVGIGLVMAGLFPPDPALGYPPGTPAGLPTGVSDHGGVHYTAALAVFVGLAASMFIAARWAPSGRARTWAVYSIVSGMAVLAGWLGSFMVVGPSGLIETAGLGQRIAIIAGFLWVVVLAWLELGRLRAVGPASVRAG